MPPRARGQKRQKAIPIPPQAVPPRRSNGDPDARETPTDLQVLELDDPCGSLPTQVSQRRRTQLHHQLHAQLGMAPRVTAPAPGLKSTPSSLQMV